MIGSSEKKNLRYTDVINQEGNKKEELKMPKVGDKNFPYTSAGVRAAQLHAKSTGQKVQMMKKGGTKKPVLKYKKGGMKKTKKKK